MSRTAQATHPSQTEPVRLPGLHHEQLKVATSKARFKVVACGRLAPRLHPGLFLPQTFAFPPDIPTKAAVKAVEVDGWR